MTDLIGTGTRVNRMLDKFWRVPSVKSWVSGKWIEFIVVAAAGTLEGTATVESHRLQPTIIAELVVPTIGTWKDQTLADQWRRLIAHYGVVLHLNVRRWIQCFQVFPFAVKLRLCS